MEDIPLFHEGSGIQIESFDAPSSLVRQNSVLLAELKQESLSRKSSSNLQIPQRLFLFSRNPSLEGNQYFAPQLAPVDSTAANVHDIIEGFIMMCPLRRRDRSWKPCFGVEQVSFLSLSSPSNSILLPTSFVSIRSTWIQTK